MKNGKEIIQGSPNTLREYLRQDMLKISFASKEEARSCFEPLKSTIGLKESDLRHDKIITGLKNGRSDLKKAARWLLEHNASFLGIEMIQPTLEDVFIRLTGADEKEAG